MFKGYLELLARGENLSLTDFQIAFDALLDGGASDAQAAAFLMALRAQHETPAYLKIAAEILRARAVALPAPPGVLDIVGTGGDGLKTLNISSAAAIVAAAAGATVAKHGNYGASGPTGASDTLAALGVNLQAPPEKIQTALFDHKFAFVFAPLFHPALAKLAPVRKSLGIRTIFNLLGPIVNPARPTFMLLGVSSPHAMQTYADILPGLGVQHAWIVRGQDGMDELSPCAPSDVVRVQHGSFSRFTISLEDVGLPRATPEQIIGGDAAHNAVAMQAILNGTQDISLNAYRNAVIYNAGAALLIAGRAGTPLEGVRLATAAIQDSKAIDKLTKYIALTSITGMVQAELPVPVDETVPDFLVVAG